MLNDKLLIEELKKKSKPNKVQGIERFFKTGKGQYGEGDKFLGVTVPDVSKLAKGNLDVGFDIIQKLIVSQWHEVRLLALKILVYKYQSRKATPQLKKEIFNFYIKNLDSINNWDLVDTSAPHIVGDHLLNKDKKLLYRYAKSKNLWLRRIAIISTFTFIRNGELDDTFRISDILLHDKHDLMHKAVGWMLREAGKKDIEKLKKYLVTNISIIPRTALRYAIEKFTEGLRKEFFVKKIRTKSLFANFPANCADITFAEFPIFVE